MSLTRSSSDSKRTNEGCFLMSEIFKYNSTALSYFRLLGKQAGSTVSTTQAGSSGSGRQILGLVGKTGSGEQDPSSPNRAGRNAGTRGPSQAQDRHALSVQTPLRFFPLPHLSLYLRKSPGIR